MSATMDRLFTILSKLGENSSKPSLLQRMYSYVFRLLGENEFLASLLGTYGIILVGYWLTNAILLYTDLTGRPHFISQFKVQKGQNEPADRKRVLRVLKVAMFNLGVLNLLGSYGVFLLQKRVGVSFRPEDVPSVPRILLDFIVSTFVQEIIFYYSHRLLHIPSIYRLVHKQHHEWTAPIGIVCVYATPIEYLTGNGLSVLLGPVLMRSHIVTFWLWNAAAIIVTSIHHSGYHLPLLPSPQFHDYHHLTFSENFGTLGILDWLHGTDKKFRHSVQYRRHRVLYGTKPIASIIKEPYKPAKTSVQ